MRSLFILTALGVCAAASATDNQPIDTEEIIVRATPLGDVLQPSEVLSDEQLLLRTSPTLGETLANELGVNSSYFGPASSRPVIRGLAGSRVKMLSDSISTLDVSDVSPDHAVAVEPLLADSIEIIRGPTTLLYGSAAAGGVVNVTDNRIPRAPAEKSFGGVVELRGDTAAEERSAVGRLDGGFGQFAWHVDGFTRETENIDIDGFATADPAERPEDEEEGTLANSYGESDGVAGGLSWVGDWGYLGASVSQLDQTYGLPGPEPEEAGGEPEIYEGPFLDMEQTRVDIRGEYRFDEGFFESVKLAYGTNDYEHVEVEPTGEVATTFENDAWQARFEAVHSPLAAWRGALGVQFDDRDFSAIGEEAFVSPTKTEAWGLFLVEERDFSWGHLHLGVRADSTEHDNEILSDYDETALSAGLGVAIGLPSETEFIVNLSRTERNPNAEELYSDGAHIATRQFEVGLLVGPGATATTEDSLNLEFGLQRETGSVRYDVNFFYYDISEYVYQDLTGDVDDGLPVAQYTQDDADFLGAEAAAVAALPVSEGFGTELRVFADFVSAELDNGDDLPRIPPWRLGANLQFSQANWLAGLDVIYNAEQDDISSFNTEAYTRVNVNLLYRLDWQGIDWELFARGTNLLDEDARKSTSFLAAYAPLPGVSLHMGVRAKF